MCRPFGSICQDIKFPFKLGKMALESDFRSDFVRFLNCKRGHDSEILLTDNIKIGKRDLEG